MEESCPLVGGSPVLAAPETDLALSSGDSRAGGKAELSKVPAAFATTDSQLLSSYSPGSNVHPRSHLRAIFPKCEGGPGLGTQGCPGDPGVATLSEGHLSARAFPCAVRGSRQLSTQLSPALLCGGSSEAPWPVQRPSAGQQLSGNRN